MDPFKIAQEVYDSTAGLSVPDEYRKLAYKEILAHRLASIKSRPTKSEEMPGSDPELSPSHRELAAVIGLSPYEVARLYRLDEEELSLAVPISKLPTNLREATEVITVLILAGRQGLSLEASTSQSVVKDEVIRLKRHNRGNFASYVGGLEKYVTYRGSGAQRQLVLKPIGYEYARSIANEILGGDQ